MIKLVGVLDMVVDQIDKYMQDNIRVTLLAYGSTVMPYKEAINPLIWCFLQGVDHTRWLAPGGCYLEATPPETCLYTCAP